MVTNVSVDKLLVMIQVNITKGSSAKIKELEGRMTKLEKQTKKTEGAMKHLEKGLMGVGLSTLFTGMAIKRLATGILTSLVTAFVTARDEGDFFVNKLLAVQAAFEFLKFAIFDAFANTEFFVNLIDGIISVTNAVSSFIAKRPMLATMIVIFTLIAIAVGAVMMVVGQLSLSLLAIPGIISLVKGAFIAFQSAGVIGVAAIIAKILILTAIISLIAFSILSVIIFWDEFKNGAILNLKRVGAFLTFWWANFKNNLGLIGDLWKLNFANMKKIAIKNLNTILKASVDMVNGIIRAFNRIPGFNIKTLEFKPISTEGVNEDIHNIAKSVQDRLLATDELKRLHDIEQGRLKYELMINKQNIDQKVDDFLGGFGFNTAPTEETPATHEPAQGAQVNMTFNGPTNSQDVKDMLEEYFRTVSAESIGSPNGG